MKKLLFTISLIFSFVLMAIAQNSPCPTIRVTGPDKIIAIGESMTFTAKVEGIDLEKIKYEWTITNGEIANGQNTSTITVATNTDLAGETIIATVKINGLSQNCKNEAYGFGEVASPIPIGIFYRKMDEYGRLSWKDEKERLKNVAIETKNDPDSMLILIFFLPSKENLKNFKFRLTRIGKFLTEFQGIDKDRIRFLFKYDDYYGTEIQILPMSNFGDITTWGDDIERLFPKNPAKKKPKSKQK